MRADTFASSNGNPFARLQAPIVLQEVIE